MKKIRVLYAEDHTGFRQAVIRELNALGLHHITGVSNGKELIDSMAPQPHVILLDLQMPIMNGSQAFDYILEHWPEARIIIVSMHYEGMLVENFLARGARGYISKDTFAGDIGLLAGAIRKVAKGGIFVCDVPPPGHTFTQRQKEMIPFIVEGLTNKEISSQVGMMERAVEKQKKKIYAKVGGDKAFDFYKYAFERGLQFLGKGKK
jgi:DNA-binding NarL/FixJ family response regulator